MRQAARQTGVTGQKSAHRSGGCEVTAGGDSKCSCGDHVLTGTEGAQVGDTGHRAHGHILEKFCYEEKQECEEDNLVRGWYQGASRFNQMGNTRAHVRVDRERPETEGAS